MSVDLLTVEGDDDVGVLLIVEDLGVGTAIVLEKRVISEKLSLTAVLGY